MGRILILFFVLALTSCGDTGDDILSTDGDTEDSSLSIESVSLAWDPSPNEEVIGYKVYIGRASGDYYRIDDVGNVLTYTVKNLEHGTYYFVCTAYDASGNESKYSDEVHITK